MRGRSSALLAGVLCFFLLVVLSEIQIADTLREGLVEGFRALQEPRVKLWPLRPILDVSGPILHDVAVTPVREFLPLKNAKLRLDCSPLPLKESERLLRLAVPYVELTPDST